MQGPKIRTGKLKDGGVKITRGQVLTLRYAPEQTSNDFIPIDYRELANDVKVGARILLDDGLLCHENY